MNAPGQQTAVAAAAAAVAIKYVGLKTAGEDAFRELTGGIVWFPDSVHNIPPAVAGKLLQHPDVFARDDGQGWPHHQRQAPVQQGPTGAGLTMAQRVAAAAGEPIDSGTTPVQTETVAVGRTREYLDHLLGHDVAGDENADEFVGELKAYFGELFTEADEQLVRAKCAGTVSADGGNPDNFAPVLGGPGPDERVAETAVTGTGEGLTLAPGATVGAVADSQQDPLASLSLDGLREYVKANGLGGKLPGYNMMGEITLRERLAALKPAQE